VLPEQSATWQFIEEQIRQVMQNYAYTEMRTPILERTQLFKRSIGEVTDIVEKEMFTFPDQNDESLTLRPEGTAGCVRACIEHSLLRNQQQHKLWYCGPMFRYERPQKGRYRQFMQLGVEAFNYPGPDIDAEQLALCARLWERLGIGHMLQLQLNSLGDSQSRNAYRQKLVEYFSANLQKLDEDSKRRLHTNPMRILDSKNPDMQDLIAAAPILLDHIDAASKEHFAGLQQELTALGIKFTINPRIVRGLDYYNRTVFEWVTDQLGSQSAVCAGGRYDTLVGMLNGPDTPAVGFAMGIERALLLVQLVRQDVVQPVDAFLICVGAAAESKRLIIAEQIRDQLPHLALNTYLGSGSLGNLFKKADKSAAKIALVIGDEELANGTVSIKFLRADRPQQTVTIAAIKDVLGDI
jgi:histidyl-tRNA synthetase